MLRHPSVLLTLGCVLLASAVAVEWKPCPVYTNVALDPSAFFSVCGEAAQPADLKAVCADVPLPLDPTGAMPGNITVFLKRIMASGGQPSKGNVFLLNGGPGDSGVYMECLVRNLSSTTAGAFDIYIPDHRGTGRSAPLTCGNNQANGTQACQLEAMSKYSAAYLAAFSTTNAAHDVHDLMQLVAPEKGGETMIYGVSYGTYWTQRLLQLYPNVDVARIVLDGVVAPDVTRFTAYDSDVSVVGQALLRTCAEQSSLCRERLGAYPQYGLHLVHNLLAAGGADLPCYHALQARMTLSTLTYGLGALLIDPVRRLGIAPVVSRLLRCNTADVAALTHLLDTLAPVGQAAGGINGTLVDNSLLGVNIGRSELYNYAASSLTPAQVIDSEISLLMTAYVGVEYAHAVQNGWPAYPRPDYGYANTSIPILATNGDLDAQTEYDFAVWATRHYPSATLIRVPGAVHASAFPGRATPVGGTVPCGMLLASSFFVTGSPNTTCLSNLPPIDWGGTTPTGQSAAEQLFGTSSLWD